MSTKVPKDTADKGGYRQINKSLNICAFTDYLESQTSNLPTLPNVSQLSPRVVRVLGQNPGKFTFQGTNTFLVGTGSSRILIDTSGGEEAYISLLTSELSSRNITLSHVLITHWHGDHSGGAPELARLYPHLSSGIYKNDPEAGQQPIADGQIFRVEGATVRALHAPGHSHDHMVFVLEEENAMFTGDNILGHGTSAVEDLGLYMRSLRIMGDDKGCGTGYPAHGVTIGDLKQKIERELAGKVRREDKVMEALRKAGAKLGLGEVVTGIYGEGVEEETRTLALEPFVDEILRKLAGDGKVGFEIRGGKKRWYEVPPRKTRVGTGGGKADKGVGMRVNVREIVAVNCD